MLLGVLVALLTVGVALLLTLLPALETLVLLLGCLVHSRYETLCQVFVILGDLVSFLFKGNEGGMFLGERRGDGVRVGGDWEEWRECENYSLDERRMFKKEPCGQEKFIN